MVTTRQRRDVVTHLLAGFPTSARRACELLDLSRSRWHYQPRRPRHDELRERLRELAGMRPRWGYQRLHILLKREGRLVNHKLVLRLYREEGLAVARRRRQKRVSVPRVPLLGFRTSGGAWISSRMHWPTVDSSAASPLWTI